MENRNYLEHSNTFTLGFLKPKIDKKNKSEIIVSIVVRMGKNRDTTKHSGKLEKVVVHGFNYVTVDAVGISI